MSVNNDERFQVLTSFIPGWVKPARSDPSEAQRDSNLYNSVIGNASRAELKLNYVELCCLARVSGRSWRKETVWRHASKLQHYGHYSTAKQKFLRIRQGWRLALQQASGTWNGNLFWTWSKLWGRPQNSPPGSPGHPNGNRTFGGKPVADLGSLQSRPATNASTVQDCSRRCSLCWISSAWKASAPIARRHF